MKTNIFNPSFKTTTKLNRNFFYATTIFVILLMLISNFFLNNVFNNLVEQSYYWNIVLCSFRYVGGWQLLSNIMGFLVVSIFLERHYGSLKYLFLIILIIPLANITTFAFVTSWSWGGFSGVVYFLYASVLLVLIFNFKNYFVGKVRWIFPVIIIAAIIVMMSLDWGGNGISDVKVVLFKRFTNIGLMGPFFTGLIVGLFSRVFAYKDKRIADSKDATGTEKSETEKTEVAKEDKKKKKEKKEKKNKKKDSAKNTEKAEKIVWTEETFLLECCRLAKELNANGKDFSISELVRKVLQDDNEVENYIKTYGEKIYKALKEGIKNHNLNAKIILIKRGDNIIYEKIQFIKIK